MRRLLCRQCKFRQQDTPAQGKPSRRSLAAEELGEERMVLIPSGLKPFVLKKNTEIPLLGIMQSAESQKVFERRARLFARRSGIKFVSAGDYRSWTAGTQMACAGLGHAVVPLAMAAARRGNAQLCCSLLKPLGAAYRRIYSILPALRNDNNTYCVENKPIFA